MTPEEVWHYNYIRYLLGDWKHGVLVKTYLRINKVSSRIKPETLDEMIDYLLAEKSQDEYGIELVKSAHPYTTLTIENIIGCRRRIFRINKIVAHINKVKQRINT